MARARVLVVEHQASCPPAHLGRWLDEAGVDLDVRRPYLLDRLPEDLADHQGLLVLGGSMAATDDDSVAWLEPTRELVRDADRRGLATLGVCLGHQLCAVALGGAVRPSPHGQQVGMVEIGWTEPPTEPDPLGLDAARSPGRRGLFWNDDTVCRVPDGATVLARTTDGDPQAIRYRESVWGVQWHPEADADLIRAWADGDADRHREQGLDQGGRIDEVRAAWDTQALVERDLAHRFAAQVRLRSVP